MPHTTPAAAGCQMSSHLTKELSRNLVDSIANSLQSPLFKMISNSPPLQNPKPHMLPSPHHLHQCVLRATLAAAEAKCVRHFTKCPTQNLGDGIRNSLESPLSKMLPNSPPPPHSQ
jgi:hypothetical protein